MVIGVGDIQKNIGLFKNMTQPIHIIDKKTHEILAMILPDNKMEKYNLTDSLGGILHRKNQTPFDNINTMIEDAYEAQMREKYGR